MNDIGEQSDVVIIGGVACGPKTAATLARRMPDLKITLFQKEADLSYGTCGLPYFASGDISGFEELTITSYGVPRDVGFFDQTKGFAAVPRAEVVKIDREAKKVTVRLLDDGSEIEHGYDKLVIATGATPNRAPFPIPESDRVRTFTRPEDARAFRKLAETGQVGSAVIVGGGFIGCELTEATASLWGLETTLVEREPQVLPYVLDREMAALAEAEMRRQDVTVYTDATVEKVTLNDEGNPVVHIAGRDPIATDFVFLCLGVTPNIALAGACGLEIGETGGITVSEHLQTTDPDIYAGGDCIEQINLITERRCYMPMGSLANRHGRVIAENIAGNVTEWPGVYGAFLVKVFDRNVGSVGLSEEAAAAVGLKIKTVWGTFPDHAEYYPESQSVVLKMVYAEEDMRLVGLQAVGAGDIFRRIDVFSAQLQHQATVDDLLEFEHGYAPPFSEALDPLHHLAAVAIAQQVGTRFGGPDAGKLKSMTERQWLDVREPDEVAGKPWQVPGVEVKTIPLGELRARIGELDRAKPAIVICRRGPRSYQAGLILNEAGFDDVVIVAGGTSAIAQLETEAK